METKIYNQKGKEVGQVDLPENIFGLAWNNDLVHQVAVSMMSNARKVIAHTKDRSEVRGGGIKPWKQKGTGRARHGSKRSPIWIGGGITFGPIKDKNYSKKINKKMTAKAFLVALSQKMRDGEILFVESFDIKNPKTKEAGTALNSFSKIKGFEKIFSKKKNSAFVSLGDKSENVVKSFRNIANIEVGELRNLNLLDLLNYKYLIISDVDKSLDFLTKKVVTK